MGLELEEENRRVSWQAKQVLVTGAGGFIGSYLSEELTRIGAKVRAFLRYNSRGDIGLLRHLRPDILERIEIIAGDLRDLHAVEGAVAGSRIVFHLGALVSIPYSYQHPIEVAETNLLGTLKVLQSSRKAGIERLIHVSTSEVYGTARHVPIEEDHPVQAQSPYAASKIGADKLAESYFRTFKLPVVTVRPFNTYGPRQSTRAVIPTIVSQALTMDTIRLGNLGTLRDFTYVSDTVRGLIKAADAPNVEGLTFNLGSGKEIRIKELAELIVGFVGRQVRIEVDPVRLRPEHSEVMRLLSDNSRARKHLDWQPVVNLEQGLKQTIKWIQDHLDQYPATRYSI